MDKRDYRMYKLVRMEKIQELPHLLHQQTRTLMIEGTFFMKRHETFVSQGDKGVHVFFVCSRNEG